MLIDPMQEVGNAMQANIPNDRYGSNYLLLVPQAYIIIMQCKTVQVVACHFNKRQFYSCFKKILTPTDL